MKLILIIFLSVLTNYIINLKIQNHRKKSVQKLLPEEKFFLKQIYLQNEFYSKSNTKNRHLMNLERKNIIFLEDNGNSYKYKINGQIKIELDRDINILTLEA